MESHKDILQRQPVWIALSEFYLDTELDEHNLKRMRKGYWKEVELYYNQSVTSLWNGQKNILKNTGSIANNRSSSNETEWVK